MASTRTLAPAVAAGACLALSLTAAAPARAAAPDGALRINELQVIGTHNGYHRELPEAEKAAQLTVDPGAPAGLYYSHASIPDQLGAQGVRNIELDVVPDPEGGLYAEPLVRRLAGAGPLTDPAWREPGTKVVHIVDTDYGTTCVSLVACLTQVRTWSAENPGHVPISIMLEFKQSEDRFEAMGGVQTPPWDAAALDALDAEIRSVFGEDDLVTPDDVRRDGSTLEESVLEHGWPTLEDSRGDVLFFMDDDADTPVSQAYLEGSPVLEGRVLFTNSLPGRPDAAFVKRNDPLGQNLAQIQELVASGYYVRTRSDLPLGTVTTGDTRLRDAALASGAQIVSTDFPAVGMAARYDSDFVVQLPGGSPARCNPVLLPPGCDAAALED
jgi:hypothetical protein